MRIFTASILFVITSALFSAEYRERIIVADALFQPGVRIDAPVREWISVKLPFRWTSGQFPKERAATSWAKDDMGDCNSGWYLINADIPSSWNGRRVSLIMSNLMWDARVWVNDREIGEVKGPDVRLDISGAVSAGASNGIRIWVTRWWEGISNSRINDPFRNAAIQRMLAQKDETQIRRRTAGGVAGAVVLEATSAAGALMNVRIETSYRKKEIAVIADYYAAGGISVAASVVDMNGKTDGLPQGQRQLDASANRIRMSIPWKDPALWEVESPHLYQLRTSLVDAGGNTIDAYAPVRFGFREIWTEGRNIMMNGHPLKLRRGYFVSTVTQMIFFQGMGFNAVTTQPHGAPWFCSEWGGGFFVDNVLQTGSKELLDAADERGIAVLMSAPTMNDVRDGMTSPSVQRDYERYMELWMHRHDMQNRPSIIIWEASMNTMGAMDSYDPEKIGRRMKNAPAWKAAGTETIKRVDPTRLVMHHDGGAVGDIEMPNFYLNFAPLQEREEYLSSWAAEGDMPWGTAEHGPPYSANFFKWYTVPLFTEYGAMYFGDKAYALEDERYVGTSLKALALPVEKPDTFSGERSFNAAGGWSNVGTWTSYYQFMDLFIRNTGKAYRAWGSGGGLFPWIFGNIGFGHPPGYEGKMKGWYLYENIPGTERELMSRPAWASPIYDAYRATMQPLLVFIGGQSNRFTAKDHNYASMDRIEKTICVVWDGPGQTNIVVEWKFLNGERIFKKGEERFALKPGTVEKRSIDALTPPLTERAAGSLAITALDAATRAVITTDALSLSYFPRPENIEKIASKWGIYDPFGRTADVLARRAFRPITVGTAADRSGIDTLIIGYKALAAKKPLPFTPADVREGLNVLMLEQDMESLESLGFRVQNVVPRIVYPRKKDHPVLDGIRADDLSQWRGESSLLPRTSKDMREWPWPHIFHWGNYGAVASVIIETPHHGAFSPLIECEFDLAYSPLIEYRDGKGIILFSQLDITDRIYLDPVAERLLQNMIRYLDAPAHGVQAKSVAIRADAASVAYFEDMALNARRISADERSSLSAANDILLVGAGAKVPELSAARAFAAQGGTAIILAQKPQTMQEAGFTVGMEKKRMTAVRTIGGDSFLADIGPELLHFRTYIDAEVFVKAPTGGMILADGLMMSLPEGKGRLFFSQLSADQFSDGSRNLRRTRWNIKRLYRQILTAAGAAMRESDTAGLSPRRFASFADIALWQVLRENVFISPIGRERKGNVMPILNDVIDAEAAVASGDAKVRERNWILRGMTAGFMDLKDIFPPKEGVITYAVTHVYSTRARTATAYLSCDYWCTFKVNGSALVDHGSAPRPSQAPRMNELEVKIPLTAGWNRLEMKVASGSGGVGFWCRMTDPGDLVIMPSVTAPQFTPDTPGDDLLEEPAAVVSSLYAEPLMREDDPYGFTRW
ncbi:MAG: sugar-binding domain-containing protein [Spirochaetota bacterium]